MLQKLQNFPKGKDNRTTLDIDRIKDASSWQYRWSFIEEDLLNRNISYHMQYIQFLIELYNSYHITLTLESLLCKNILVEVNLLIEAVLSYSVKYAEGKKSVPPTDKKNSYIELIGKAYHEHQIISKDLWHSLHELRKQGNYRHIQSEYEREFEKYKIEDANNSIDILEEVREELSEYFSQFSEEE